MDYSNLKDKIIHLITNHKSGPFNLTAAEIADIIIGFVKEEEDAMNREMRSLVMHSLKSRKKESKVRQGRVIDRTCLVT